MDLFRHPTYLLAALTALAGSSVLGIWSSERRRRIRRSFARGPILRRLFPQKALEVRRWSYLLRAAALTLILVAAAGPQWGVRLVTTRSKATLVMIAVDTSKSMLAEDLKPNRMEKAKNALSLLIDGLKGSRIGLIAFAGEAFIQCPLTTDTAAVKSLLRRLRTGMLRRQGTELGKAITVTLKALAKYPGHKALVLLSDGEDHGSRPREAARAAAEAGIHLYIIGMGTPEGEPIPIKDKSGKTTGYKKDSRGSTVVSRLNEKSLIELAEASRGAYYRATSSEDEINAVVRHIEELEKSDLRTATASRYRNRYRLPLALAFLLLLVELFLSETAGPGKALAAEAAGQGKPREKPRRGRRPAALGLLLAVPLLSGWNPKSDLKLLRGNAKYKSKDYGEALKRYKQSNGADPKTPFNTGAALYQMGDFAGAEEVFETVTDPKKVPPAMASKAYYNKGNAHFRQKEFAEAAHAYEACLLLDPSDEDCRHNLVLSLRPPKPQKQKKNNSGGGGSGKDKKKNKKKPDSPREKPQSKDRSKSRRPKAMSKEDADRILQAIKEKERAAQQAQPVRPRGTRPPKRKEGKDW